jgi:hypothetical protein
MTRDEYERLAWERIDGEITPGDLARLEAIEAGNPDFRVHLEQLRTICDELSRAREVSPPAELRPRIDRALGSSSPGWRRTAPVVNLWRPRLAYLAAGLVVGAVVARLLLTVADRPIEPDRVTGTMRVVPTRAAQQQTIDFGENRGSLNLARQDDIVIVDAELTADLPFEVMVEAEGGSLSVRGMVGSGARPSRLVVDSSRVALHADGAGRHRLELAPSDPSMTVRVVVVCDGRTVANRTVDW